MNYTDEDILLAIRHGDNRKAIDFFYEDFWPTVRRHVLKRGGNEEDAKDTYHYGILKFLESVKRSKYDKEKGEIKGFIFAICRNYRIDVARKSERETIISDEHNEQRIGTVTIDTSSKETEGFIQQLFAQLGEKCAGILRYFFYDNLKMDEIAVNMGFKNANVAKNEKSKCSKKLVELLKANAHTKSTLLDLLRN